MQKNSALRTQIILSGLICFFNFCAYANDTELGTAIQNARNACSGISESLTDMKKIAGINTALTGVGTATGAVALGTGLAKANVDDQIAQLIQNDTNATVVNPNNAEKLKQDIKNYATQNSTQTISGDNQELKKLEKKSKTLGNIRTGTLAVSAVTDTTGAVLAIKNRVNEELKQTITNCITAINELTQKRMRARVEETANEQELTTAERIETACKDWENVDLSKIDKKAKIAAISGGTGGALGLIGTITSGIANSDKVRSGDDSKEKNLNTTSNVLAGGTTVASGVATIFNATQISAIKKVVAAADKCEGGAELK